MSHSHPELGLALRTAYPRARATLIRLLGDFDRAEEALQEAATRAAVNWPKNGIPDNPAAWLVRTGRNFAIDIIRRRQVESRHAQSIAVLEEHRRLPPDENAHGTTIADDLLRLIFTCSHPALAPEGRIALTLKTVAGLTVEEISSAFLTSTAAMEKRLTRTKKAIREKGIAYEVPGQKDLPERLEAVLAVVYLIFNEGYKAAEGPELVRPRLCADAIRLGRILARAFRQEPDVSGLLALMLLNDARTAARLDATGTMVPLDEQDRTLWNHAQIREGSSLVEKTLRRGRPGPYQIQAAIAALHDQAARAEDTDWAQIAVLYGQLEILQPSPVITLNRAVAVARAEDAEAGLAILDGIATLPTMVAYHHYHAAHGALLAEAGQTGAALTAYEKALDLAGNRQERDFLEKKIAGLKK